MLLYQLTYTALNEGGEGSPHTEWFASERAAVVRRLDLFNQNKLVGKKREAQIWPVEVPSRKAELIDWLNEGGDRK